MYYLVVQTNLIGNDGEPEIKYGPYGLPSTSRRAAWIEEFSNALRELNEELFGPAIDPHKITVQFRPGSFLPRGEIMPVETVPEVIDRMRQLWMSDEVSIPIYSL